MKIAKSFIFLISILICAASSVWAQTAKAEIKSTQPESPLMGSAQFEETAEGVKVTVELTNAPAGPHGIHVHEFASCDDQGKAAGGHFNPVGAPHGFLPKDGTSGAHAGDFGNIEVGEDGKANLELTVPNITVAAGEFSIVNHALIIHAKPDSFVQPTGDAGDRIGCGIIS